MRTVVSLDGVTQTRAHATRHVCQGLNIGAVHHSQQFGRGRQVRARFAQRDSVFLLRCPTQMGVDIDDREFRPGHERFGDVQHALGLEILEQ